MPFNVTSVLDLQFTATDSFGLETVVPLELTSEGPCNRPPVASGVPQDNAIELPCDANITDLAITFEGPEADDVVALTYNSTGPTDGLTVDIVNGTLNLPNATATIDWDTSGLPFNVISVLDLQFTATDSFGLETVVPLEITSEGPCNRPPEVTGSDVDISAMTLSCGQGINDMIMTFSGPEAADTVTLTYEVVSGETTAGLNIIVNGKRQQLRLLSTMMQVYIHMHMNIPRLIIN